jgi:hypothetical protein
MNHVVQDGLSTNSALHRCFPQVDVECLAQHQNRRRLARAGQVLGHLDRCLHSVAEASAWHSTRVPEYLYLRPARGTVLDTCNGLCQPAAACDESSEGWAEGHVPESELRGQGQFED